jgi:dienelactone hydrolase
MLALAGGWIMGTATWLLFPAVAGLLAHLLLMRSRHWWRRGGVTVALGGILLSAIACWLFPLPVFPELTGPFAVGTFDSELAAEGDAPPLVMTVWYPSNETTDLPPVPWLPDRSLAGEVPFHRIGSAFSRARSGLKALESTKRLPVVFYEPSWTGHRAENVAQTEELASWGFVVTAVDHPGQSDHVNYRNGNGIQGTLPSPPDLVSADGGAQFQMLVEKCLLQRADHLERVRLALANGTAERLKDHLNLDRMGVFGFSFGGASAWRLCARNPAFFAGANEDGLILDDDPQKGPFLFFDEEMPFWLLESPRPNEGPAEKLTRSSEKRIQFALQGRAQFREIIHGTRHHSFSERIFTCRFPQLAHAGSKPATKVHQIITSRLTSFFKKSLRMEETEDNQ